MFEALLAGRAFVDLSSWRKIAVSGRDAFSWLGDLVSADLTGVGPERARRSLLLSPTGRVRAEFTVTVYEGDLLLLQDAAQPHPIDALLNRYVLSSDVALRNRAGDLALFALPDRSEPLEIGGAALSVPSCLGPGMDAISPMPAHDEVGAALASTLRRAEEEDLESWRVFRGIPRVGADVGEDDLPQEGALEEAVSFGKGCYVGQEAVAKVRNLGHPRRLLLHGEASGPVRTGESVCADGAEVGKVTSVSQTPRGVRALLKVRWDARRGPFVTAGGTQLVPLGDGA